MLITCLIFGYLISLFVSFKLIGIACRMLKIEPDWVLFILALIPVINIAVGIIGFITGIAESKSMPNRLMKLFK